jgi:hypothetical protein
VARYDGSIWPRADCDDDGVAEESVSREGLLGALALPEAADRACRAAVSEGAGFRVWSAAVPVVQLVTIYERRVRHLAGKGIASVGSESLVDRLRAVEADVLRLGLVHSEAFNFTLFLDPVDLRVVACVGVAASTANQGWDWSTLTS